LGLEPRLAGVIRDGRSQPARTLKVAGAVAGVVANSGTLRFAVLEKLMTPGADALRGMLVAAPAN
jgi:hypothetical protein